MKNLTVEELVNGNSIERFINKDSNEEKSKNRNIDTFMICLAKMIESSPTAGQIL